MRALQLYFLCSLGLLLFAGGFLIGYFRLPPATLFGTMRAEIWDWKRYAGHRLRARPEKFLAPLSDIRKEFRVSSPQPGWYPGDTFMAGFFGNRSGMRLIAPDGTVLHHWDVDFSTIFPQAPHLQRPLLHPWDSFVHGAILYPNGDVVFNFEYAGLVRIDRCSRVKWKIARQTSHTVEADDDGNLWVPTRQLRDRSYTRYPDMPGPLWEESILKVAPDGRILREISVLELLFNAHQESVLLAHGESNLGDRNVGDRDITHLNDFEVLPRRMAAAFPLFEPGDALISLRNVNLLMVVAPQTGAVKWTMTGPFIHQHDPDFEENGHISVFDNRTDGRQGRVRGGSRILDIDPNTHQVTTLYGGRAAEFFYTHRMGNHQRLPNGNLLIVVAEGGYVFEVTPQRKVVWSYVNRWDGKSAAWIESATRYGLNYMTTDSKETCNERSIRSQ